MNGYKVVQITKCAEFAYDACSTFKLERVVADLLLKTDTISVRIFHRPSMQGGWLLLETKFPK